MSQRVGLAPAVDAGLTLIEMLVVLAIIGVASGATVLSLGSHGPGAEVEARRLAGTIQAGADAAMTGNAPISLRADTAAYEVGSNRHVLPDGMRLEGAPAAPVTLDDNSAVELTLVRGSEAWNVRFDGLRATAARATAAQ